MNLLDTNWLEPMHSQFKAYRDVLVIDLVLDDFESRNYLYDFMRQVDNYGVNNVVINLSEVDILTSTNIDTLQHLYKSLQVYGKKTIVCGINPSCASVLINFLTSFNFKTALNIDRALYEINS